jgi:hypothetical protein
VTDRLRVMDDAGDSFLIDPNTGAFVDSDPTAPGVNMDRPQDGIAVEAIAYTNNRQTTTLATLYAISSYNDTLTVRRTANAGESSYTIPILHQGGRLDVSTTSGFDILPGINVDIGGIVAVGKGYALVSTASGGGTELYAIDLTTGVADLVDFLGDDETSPVRGFAVQGEEVPGGFPTMIVTARFLFFPNTLGRFNTAAARETQQYVLFSGLRDGEVVAGIDYRPQTGQLYAITLSPTLLEPPDDYLILIRPLDPLTGVLGQFVSGDGPAGSVTPQTGVGFDFDPTTDRARVVVDDGRHLLLGLGNPASGTSGTVSGLPPGSTGLTAAAYTNSFGQPLAGSGPTTLYTLDAESDQLFIQSPPQSGVQTHGMPVMLNRFPIGLPRPLHFLKVSGFDIPAYVRVDTSGAPATGKASRC